MGFGLTGFAPSAAQILLNRVPGASALYMPDRKLSTRIINGARVLKDAGDPKPEADFSPAQISRSELLTFLDGADGKTPINYDWSGNGNHATQTTVAAQPFIATAGVLEEGLRFAGGQWLSSLPVGSTFMQGDLTITTWFKAPVGSAEGRLFGVTNTGFVTTFNLTLQVGGINGRAGLQARNEGGQIFNENTSAIYTAGQWCFLVITKTISGTTANWVGTIDGATFASQSQDENYALLDFLLPLGATNNRGAIGGFFTGNTAFAGIYPRALTANEINTVKTLTDPTA
jgi:hypothetical protein